MIMNLPFEQKKAETLFRNLHLFGVEERTYIENGKNGYDVANYVVLYDRETDAFYGISVKRFLSGNYYSAKKLVHAEDLIYKLKKLGSIQRSRKEETPFYEGTLYLCGMNDYSERHPDDGYTRIMGDLGEEECYRVAYAIAYLDNPLIRTLIDEDHTKPVIDFIRGDGNDSYFGFFELLKQQGSTEKVIGIDKEYDAFIEKHFDQVVEDWNLSSFQKLCNIHHASVSQLETIMDLDLNQFTEILTLYPDAYSVDSLLAYLERAERYQAIDKNTALFQLEEYLSRCKDLNMTPDHYPASLTLARDEMQTIQDKYDLSSKKVETKANMRSMILSKESYRFEDQHYLTEPILDYEELERIEPFFRWNYTSFQQTTYYFTLTEKKNKKIVALLTCSDPAERSYIYLGFMAGGTILREGKKEETFIRSWIIHNQRLLMNKPQKYNSKKIAELKFLKRRSCPRV